MDLDLALIDFIFPYVLRSNSSLGSWHAALSVIYVSEHTTAIDDNGVVIRGTAHFSGDIDPLIFDPFAMNFRFAADNTEGHPANDSGRRDPWFDLRDSHIDFELCVPRVASQKVFEAVNNIGMGNPNFAANANVIVAYDQNVAGNMPQAPAKPMPLPSDYPGTEFVLDMVFTGVVLRPPFLRGANLDSSGQLVADPLNAQVKFTLPRIKFRLSQGSADADPLVVTLLSLGATGLDDPGDVAAAELVKMEPPYAFIGPSNTVGFGFRSGFLDLSTGSTPPDVLSQFGFDESWTGLYLPEIRLFVAPHGAEDFAVNAGARNLMIGIGASAGITGDFDLTVLDQGADLHLSARFYDDVGRFYGITKTSETTAIVALPDHVRMVVDIDGGLTPYMTNVAFDNDLPKSGRLFEFDLRPEPTHKIVISVEDSRKPIATGTLTITANRRPSSAAELQGSQPVVTSPPPAEVQTTSIVKGGSPVQEPKLLLVEETPNSATISLDPEDPDTHWTIDGNYEEYGPRCIVSLPPGSSLQVKAELPGSQGIDEFTAYYRFDRPSPGDNNATKAFAIIPDNTHTTPAPDQGTNSPWPPGSDAGSALAPLLEALPPGTNIVIKGYASFESEKGETTRVYNTDLARRRAIGLQAIIENEKPDKDFTFVPDPDADMSNWRGQGDPGRNLFWKAVASWPPESVPGTVTTGTVLRRPAQTTGTNTTILVPVPDNPSEDTPPAPPIWFKRLGAKVRIVRDQFVACEVFGKFDINTAAESLLQQGKVPEDKMPALSGMGENPADGIIDVRLVVQIDDATDTVIATAYIGADPADRDGLMKVGWLPGEPRESPNLGQNLLGLGIVFMPLFDKMNDVSGDGALAELGSAAVLGEALALAELGVLQVERVIWYGGELITKFSPAVDQASLLLDLETAISFDIGIITIPPEAPLVVRYKAVGLMIGKPSGFRPIFDSSKGYTIDVSRPGAIQVAEPLGQILKVLGARIARNNPYCFEIDLGFAVDLGVVSVERARVRLKLDPPSFEFGLTAFIASVDIPGAIKGRGYLELNENEIKGQLDLIIMPETLNLRVAAGMGIADISSQKGGPATAVIVKIDVEFPVAIPLVGGLGIYGFLGLFAMHYGRNETYYVPPDSKVPALAWLRATGGNPADLEFWTPQINKWAFGVGATLGTLGSSFIFNLKGVFLFELPGPRLLLMMRANLLTKMPELKNDKEGTFLAVVDLDIGRGTLTIGLSAEYEVEPLIAIKIPAEAFFNSKDISDWHLYLGQYSDMVVAKVFGAFDATGYLMLSGSGQDLPIIDGFPKPERFSIATGLRVSYTWGSKEIGLYAQLSGSFDVIIGFSPFQMGGMLTVRGSLHLFIISIEAWTNLTVVVGIDDYHKKRASIKGEICGEVDFWLFSVSGCVSLSLGGEITSNGELPNLVESLKLISRSPTRVLGTGTGRPIDSVISNGIGEDTQPADDRWKDNSTIDNPAIIKPATDKDSDSRPSVVPIDAIPVLMMIMPPCQAPGLKFRDEPIGNTPEALNFEGSADNGLVLRGDTWYKYTLKGVELFGPLTAGKAPATWWKSKAGDKAIEAQLALLSLIPEAFPNAIGSSVILENMVRHEWGTVCQGVAPATPVLWSFMKEPLGQSDKGWQLKGIAWPDPKDSFRSTPPDQRLKVKERCRCGDPLIDSLAGVIPAQVRQHLVACPDINSENESVEEWLPGRINPNQPLTLSDAIHRFSLGQPVGREQLMTMSLSSKKNANIGRRRCECRVLAPTRHMISFGLWNERGEEIDAAYDRLHYKRAQLYNEIEFETGEFSYARFYLLVPRSSFSSRKISVVASNAKDEILLEHEVTLADQTTMLPTSWKDARGPWQKDISFLTGISRELLVPIFVEIRGISGADRIQIGTRPLKKSEEEWDKTINYYIDSDPPFFVAAIEVLRKSEIMRRSFDRSETKIKQSALTKVLKDAVPTGPSSTNKLDLDNPDYALLQPGQTYQIKVIWDCEWGKEKTNLAKKEGETQSFWFRTDSNPPSRLDPWVLASLPGEGEKHFFASEEIRIIFAAKNLGQIYDAYGKKLVARLRPSSFRPVPTDTANHPFPVTSNLEGVATHVASPWEDSVERLVEGTSMTCVSMSEERITGSRIRISIPLDLYTDYVLEIEMVDKSEPKNSPDEPVWRRSFSTGGFKTVDDFANSFQIARAIHRCTPVGDIKLQDIGIEFRGKGRELQGAEFDSELLRAGLDMQPVPSNPRVVIFWDQVLDKFPQPVALLIDSSEPMWRDCLIPEEVTSDGPSGAKHYELQPFQWLKLAQQTGGTDGGDDIVDQIIRAPGGQRALITLKPESRGKRIKLALQRIAQTKPDLLSLGETDRFSPILDLELKAAPWEEVN